MNTLMGFIFMIALKDLCCKLCSILWAINFCMRLKLEHKIKVENKNIDIKMAIISILQTVSNDKITDCR